jgi:hypothetical protein
MATAADTLVRSGTAGAGARGPPSLLAVSSEVAEALHAARPVVALESTIISHGL